jgi:hypothetical protein
MISKVNRVSRIGRVDSRVSRVRRVTQVRGHGEVGTLPKAHLNNTLVPTLDHLADTCVKEV